MARSLTTGPLAAVLRPVIGWNKPNNIIVACRTVEARLGQQCLHKQLPNRPAPITAGGCVPAGWQQQSGMPAALAFPQTSIGDRHSDLHGFIHNDGP